MSCCESSQYVHVSGKTSDMCNVNMGEIEHDGYVPEGMNIGGGDYLSFSFCINCGQMSGTWPIENSPLKDLVDEKFGEFICGMVNKYYCYKKLADAAEIDEATFERWYELGEYPDVATQNRAMWLWEEMDSEHERNKRMNMGKMRYGGKSAWKY